jgi:hypothetical protein
MKMDVYQWLLAGEPWVAYRTQLDLLQEDLDCPEVQAAYTKLTQDPKVRGLLAELADWPGPALKSHKKAGHLIHKLVFIADLGLSTDHPQVAALMEKMLSEASEEGPFRIIVNLPKQFGGSGEDELSWMLCDSGSTLYAAAKFGGTEDPRIIKAADYLASLVREETGWPCAATKTLGKFKGPGKREDPCPYSNLLMVKALLPFGERYRDQIDSGVNTLLNLWERRTSQKPFLFAMGTHFAKLKAPLVWYDILHVMDVLSQIPDIRDEEPVREMAEIIAKKAGPEGWFTPESIWMDWRGWEFGQKREPSRWLTFLVTRILSRINQPA